jgi:predicted secreted protein
VRLTPKDVRDALRRHAKDIAPDASLDPMRGLDDRVRRVRRRRAASMSLTAVLVLLLVTLVPAAVRYRERMAARPTATAPSPALPVATPTATAPAAPTSAAVPVYYLRGGRLAREFRQLGEVPDRVAAAVDAMLHRPPLDPDYSTGWPATATAELTTTESGYAVDISAAPAEGCLAVQQLVHTVTAAAASPGKPVDGVVVRIAGRPVGQLRALRDCGASPSGAVRRAPQREVLVDVEVSSPNERDRVPLTFTLTGHSRVVDGSLRWIVTDVTSGDRLVAGGAPASVASPDVWTIPVTLPWSAAGRTVDITVTGTTTGGRPAEDTKRVTVAD